MSLDRLWAGWRASYVAAAAAGDGAGDEAGACVFCAILALDASEAAGHGHPQVLRRGERAAVLLNLYPYTNGHVLVMPVRHVAELEELDGTESADVWAALAASVTALKAAYRPDGLNVGANLGRSAGAGIPGHFHLHALPRWAGDTNFMTTVADVRVIPEALADTYAKLAAAWPRD